MTLVVDASAVAAALLDRGPDGRWAANAMIGETLAAPELMPVEVANILRRVATAGEVSADSATMAHRDLLELPVLLFPYAAGGERAWELRANLTIYDATYVALAETLDAPLLTLDLRIARASGPRCAFRIPEGS